MKLRLLKTNILIFLVLVMSLFFFSCTPGNKQTSVAVKNEQDFHIPKLVQQEIVSDNPDKMEEYTLYNNLIVDGSVIPGLFQGAVPQGLAYYSDKDLILVSNYMFDSRPSCITVIDMTRGLLKKTLWLLNSDGTPYKGHVGGLAVSRKYLWITDRKGVYYVSLETLTAKDNNSNLSMIEFVMTEAKGSFASFSDNILWVGEFASKDGSYTVSKSHYFKANNNTNHAWMAGYLLDADSDLINNADKIDGIYYPDFILSIPDEVQGAAFINGKIILSRSYGRKNNSSLAIYTDTRGGLPDGEYITKNNRSIPVWIMDAKNFELEITAPPMTEGLTDYRGFLAVLFESGSDKYRSSAKNPQDKIKILNLSNEP